ncbi:MULTISPECIES: DUF2927 domain-containing protein [unclassified Yoonia]|uniref:DUF2927 domain-containing protein n=1 Tax=unclassified Yoonia TaxID=2629118 RepID=UPI002AFE81E9|nr:MULTISPECIES: DUF2927 domain-containing protein [unclassified Yoonia]
MARQSPLFVALAVMAGLLAGCETASPPAVAVAPVVSAVPAAPDLPVVAEPSAASRDLSAFYARLQNQMLMQNLLRGDGGAADTPFTDTMLARNFMQIALTTEYADNSDFQVPHSSQSSLHRWEKPIRMNISFSDSVPLAQRDQDRTSVSAFAARLSRLSGVPITRSDQNPNFHVLFLDEDDRRGAASRLRALVPNISEASLRGIVTLPRDQLCLVASVFEPGRSAYAQAVVVIRAEHPNLIRAACIHEELAQGMGLGNDSDAARPSIFNDSEEFALLTKHDELLLRMLYDPRLQTGMDATTAEPIVRQIARELITPGPS